MEFPNLEVKEFENAIVTFCNKSQLPLEVKRLCLNDVCVKLESESNKAMLAELAEREKHEKKDKK